MPIILGINVNVAKKVFLIPLETFWLFLHVPALLMEISQDVVITYPMFPTSMQEKSQELPLRCAKMGLITGS